MSITLQIFRTFVTSINIIEHPTYQVLPRMTDSGPSCFLLSLLLLIDIIDDRHLDFFRQSDADGLMEDYENAIDQVAFLEEKSQSVSKLYEVCSVPICFV